MSGLVRIFAIVVAAVAACSPLAAHGAGAPPPWQEVSLQLHPTMPDDEGRAITLDAGVDLPVSGCPCPGVLINHGFEGTWHSEDYAARNLAAHGYVVLRYSSRGFGSSGGEVDLVGPKERQDQLDAVHWLNDPANAMLGGRVVHDDIGQYGASYGGMHAWALAMSGDPAVRTVVPTAAWTDGYQALLPNDVLRVAYDAGFYATGFAPTAALIGDATGSTPMVSTQLNYSTEVHAWMAEALAGVGLDDMRAGLASRSVHGHYDRVHIPVFIIQGVNDGLFSANQAIDAYTELTRRGIATRLYVGGIGHPPSASGSTSPEALHIGAELLAWFDHYLRGADNGIDRLPPVEWSRAVYFGNHWDGTTRSAASFPFGPAMRLQLCAATGAPGGLSPGACPGAPPQVAVNTYAGAGYDEEPITGPSIASGIAQLTKGAPPDLKTAPGTLTFDSAPLTAPLDLAGIPLLHLQTASADVLPAPGLRGGAAAFQLDPKLYDLAADGSARLLTRGAFAEPLGDAQLSPQHNVDIDVFGVSYLVPAGHRLRLTLSTEDTPYLRPTVNPFAVALFAGSSIELPVASTLRQSPPIPPPVVGAAMVPAPPTAQVAPRTGVVGGIPSTSALTGGGPAATIAGVLVALLVGATRARRRRFGVA